MKNRKTTKVNYIVLRGFDGSVRGYKLGEYYLMKTYGMACNDMFWTINKDGTAYIDFRTDRNSYEHVPNCKAGKERLVELYLSDVYEMLGWK